MFYVLPRPRVLPNTRMRTFRCSPDRLPRYEHVFHKTVTAQKRRYDGQTGASALSEHHRKTIENFVLIDRAMAADVATVSNVEVSGRRTVAHKAE